MTDLWAPNIEVIQSGAGGGDFDFSQLRLLINHTVEAPDKAGMARGLSAGYFKTSGTSVHFIADSIEVIANWPLNRKSWGSGNGNSRGIQTEHTGYAGWSKDQFLTESYKKVLRNSARAQAWAWVNVIRKYHPDAPVHPKWLSLNEILNGACGLCIHNDISLTFGGTNHWDTGQNWPFDLMEQYIAEEVDKLLGVVVVPPKPTEVPPKEENELAGEADRIIAAINKLPDAIDKKEDASILLIRVGGGIGVVLDAGPTLAPRRWRGLNLAAYNNLKKELAARGARVAIDPRNFANAKAVAAAGYGTQVGPAK